MTLKTHCTSNGIRQCKYVCNVLTTESISQFITRKWQNVCVYVYVRERARKRGGERKLCKVTAHVVHIGLDLLTWWAKDEIQNWTCYRHFNLVLYHANLSSFFLVFFQYKFDFLSLTLLSLLSHFLSSFVDCPNGGRILSYFWLYWV